MTNEHWSGTTVRYECDVTHDLKWNDPEVLECGQDGKWDHETAPRCIPSNTLAIVLSRVCARLAKSG